MAGSNKDLLKKLGAVDTVAEIHNLLYPPHLKGMQAAIDALTSPPHLAQLTSILRVSGMGATLFAAVSSYQ